MPRKGRRKAKGSEAGVPPDVSGASAITTRPQSIAPERSTVLRQSSQDPSGQQVVPAYPSTSAASPEEAMRRMGLQMKYEPSVDWPFPKRPGVGKMGRKIKLVANRFTIDIPKGYIYHYDVVVYIKPNKPTSSTTAEKKKFRCLNTKENRQVLERAVQDAQRNTSHLFHEVRPAYDGRKNLYTRKPLKLRENEPKEIPVEYQSKKYAIEIKPVFKDGQESPSISLDPLHQLFEGKAFSFTGEMRSAVMALETILRHGPALKYVPVYRSFYYRPREDEVPPLGGGREIWLGYHQSLQISQWKPMITIDTSATVFYESCPLVHRLMNVLYPRVTEDRMDGELRKIRGLTSRQRDDFLSEVGNLLVEVIHLGYPRKYRISNITDAAACETYFYEEVNGRKTKKSVSEYFGKKYPSHKLRYPNLPCIIHSGGNKSTFLPFEVCKIASDQPYQKELSDNEKRMMISKTCFVPDVKFRKINNIVDSTKRDLESAVTGSRSFAKEFEIHINTTFAKLDGRVLEPPSLMYNLPVLPVDGEWNMNNKRFFQSCKPIKDWILISFANISDGRVLTRFADGLENIGQDMGIKFMKPVAKLNFGRKPSPSSLIRAELQKRPLQLAIIILPPKKDNKTIYREIKVSCETKLGLMTQCVAEKNAIECKKNVITNLCQKINAKMGGKNNSLAKQSKPEVFQKPVMIIGADCSHPSPGDTVPLSVAAVVGSLDSAPSKYRTALRIQAPEETKDRGKKPKEIILELKDMVKELLVEFLRLTNHRPEKIIFYRDGVSEGEFRQVLEKEVKQVRDACTAMNSEYKPAITYIVVGKRHHTRFRPENKAEARGGKGNVPPGTTVDTEVSHPLYFDYFMCSHLGIQGTSRPAHYTVLCDDNNFDADKLQQLTYYLCYTYTRCTRSISIPCPVMYAHLAAYRAKQYLLHWKDQKQQAGAHVTSEDEIREMNEAILVHKDIAKEMYFT